jgi:hypothetical protein
MGWRTSRNKVGTALDVSHVQINRYLGAAEHARRLREVMARSAEAAPEADDGNGITRASSAPFTGHVEFSQFNRSSERATFPLVGNEADGAGAERQQAPMAGGAQDPAKRELESMVWWRVRMSRWRYRFNQFKGPRFRVGIGCG